jgi:D-alanyl-D-alanine carboxypeptidase (penicillin-binding protein 5/6)
MRQVWVLLGLLLATAGHAESLPVPAPPQIAAKSLYLMDSSSGKVLAEADARVPLAPASLTKLMTAYAVFEALSAGGITLDDEVRVSERAWRAPGSRMFIEVDTKVRVEDLVRGMIIQSGNDASIALAEHVAGSVEAFVALMNKHAEALGMTDTAYGNPTGLSGAGHLSSARDSAILAQAIIEEFAGYYAWYGEREFTYNGITQHNRNALLWRDESVDGLKTGHTNAAGYCLVSSAERSGMRLIAVVMGMTNPDARTAASQALLDYGFQFFETHKIYARGQQVTQARVWKGEPHTVALGLSDDLYVTIPRGRYQDLGGTMELIADLVAPLGVSAQVGAVHISFRGEDLAVLPLVSLHAVAEAPLWTRIADELKLWLE